MPTAGVFGGTNDGRPEHAHPGRIRRHFGRPTADLEPTRDLWTYRIYKSVNRPSALHPPEFGRRWSVRVSTFRPALSVRHPRC